MTRALLIAVALAGCAQKKTAAPPPPPATPDAPPPRDLFEGCTAVREHGTASLECGAGLTVTLVRSQTEVAADPKLVRRVLDLARRALELDGLVIADREDRAVRGALVAEGFRYHVPEDGEVGRGLVAVAPAGQTTVQTVLCVDSRDAGACGPMTEEVLARGFPAHLLPDGGAEAQRTVTFAGRAVELPEGCSSSGGEDIACGGASFAWTRVSEDTFANAGDTFFDGMMGAAGGMPKPDFTTEMKCTIDGVDATCRRRIWTRKDTLGVAISGAAKVRDEPTAVVCFWTTDGKTPGYALPRACAPVLRLSSE